MEKQPLLNGDDSSPLSSELSGAKEKDDAPTQYPWHRWQKKQVVPALVLITAAFLGMMGAKFMGPSLADLVIRTNTSMSHVSWYISVGSFGSLIGILVLGKVIDHSSRWLQLSAAILLMGIIFAVATWFTQFWLQCVFFLLFGICGAWMLAGGELTVYCLFDHRVDSILWQNIFQLALASGGVFGPLFIQPFLLETSLDTITEHRNVTVAHPTAHDVKIMYSFSICGGLSALVGILALIVYFVFEEISCKHSVEKVYSENLSINISKGRLNLLRKAIIFLLVIYNISQSVFLRTFNNYLVPFTVNELGWTKAQGSNLSAVFFTATIVAKPFVMVIIRRVSVEVVLNLGLILCNISALALTFFLHSHSSVIWIFTIVLSFGCSIAVAVLIAWTDKHIGIKGFVGMIYSAGSSVGEMAINPLVGYLFDNAPSIYFMYLVLASTILCFGLMIVLQILGKQYYQAFNPPNDNVN